MNDTHKSTAHQNLKDPSSFIERAGLVRGHGFWTLRRCSCSNRGSFRSSPRRVNLGTRLQSKEPTASSAESSGTGSSFTVSRRSMHASFTSTTPMNDTQATKHPNGSNHEQSALSRGFTSSARPMNALTQTVNTLTFSKNRYCRLRLTSTCCYWQNGT